MRLISSKVLSYATTVCLSLTVGFYLGARFCTKDVPSATPSPQPKAEPEPSPKESSDDDEVEDLADGDLSSVKPLMMEQCKLVNTIESAVKTHASDDI